MTDSDDGLLAELDDEDRSAIAALTASDLDAIDRAILLQLSSKWRKTALVVAVAMYAYPDKYDDIPDVFYGSRVHAFAEAGFIEAQGNLRDMRLSEVRLKSNGAATASQLRDPG